MNWCSVRHSPMPSAPLSIAAAASAPLSALARTPRRRESSAQPSRVVRLGDGLGRSIVSSPTYATPVAPSIEMTSPARRTCSPAVTVSASWSMRSPPAPQIAGRPMPRATTAACDAEPPLTVRMPVAAIMPGRSPGVVSLMTSRTDSPASVISTAVSLVSAMRPTAAPGDAPRPETSGTSAPVSFGCGCSSSSTCVGAVRRTASVSSMMPRMARSTARLVATRALGRRICSSPTSARPSGPNSKSTITALPRRPSSSARTPVSISTPSGRPLSGWPVCCRSPLQRKPCRKAPLGANWPESMSRDTAKPWPSSSCSVTTTVSR